MNFKHWLLQIGKSERTAQSYSGALSGAISGWAKQAGLVRKNLSDIDRVKEFTQVVKEIKELEQFIQSDTKGKGMYGAALNHYASYLNDIYQEDVKDDIDKILGDTAIGNTEKSQLVQTRLGQGKFRKYQIDYWQRCALTGYPDTHFLVASHIKPWRDAVSIERLDRYNGLLLLPNLDKVFDLGFVSFRSQGDIIISEHLENPEMLGLRRDMKLELQKTHLGYMAYHRDMVFEKRFRGA